MTPFEALDGDSPAGDDSPVEHDRPADDNPAGDRPADSDGPAGDSPAGDRPAGHDSPADEPPFDVCGPLPTGVTLLEASAGTGKTFTIAALTARYVAAGIPLERMLLVTFTRNATGELRERVRRRLADARRGLAGAQAGVAPDRSDEVLRLLADGPPEEIDRRRERLARALADFDAATITTTHGFCHRMLAGLGVAGDTESGASVADNVDDLVVEAVDDRYVARSLHTAVPPFDRNTALRLARAAVANPRTALAPAVGAPDDPGRLRLRLALSVRRDVARRQRDTGLVTYDDLLTRLADALGDPVSGAAARARLRERYDVVLVDEFQDTDELQWRILSDAFRHAGTALVLIGDPKQAIYAFRGADVHAYLDAAGSADDRGTLGVNWRSDQGLLDAFDALWGGVSLGHPDIVYRRVEAAPAHRRSGLAARDGSSPAPLRVRVVHRRDGDVILTPAGYAANASTRAAIGRDLAARVVELLEGTWLRTRPADDRRGGGDAEVGQRRLQPGDVAVLTRTYRSANVWSAALGAAGIPSVINGVGSVFATPAAREWLVLLEALERPASSTRVHNVALTGFVGWSAEAVDAADETAWEGLHATCHHWAAVLRRAGVATLLELIARTRGLAARELSRHDGERRLTDIHHVGQLLHAEAAAERLGTTALTAWLRRCIRDTAADDHSAERSRRLESDADAVQVLTIHRSKGLEFPVVAYPDLWEPSWIPEGDAPVTYHDADGVRTIDVAGRGVAFALHQRTQTEELRGEDLRLAYVALTRARHQAIMWWAGSWDSRHSPIGRLLFARGADGTVAAEGSQTPSDDEAVERFGQLSSAAPGCISVERVTAGAATRWSPHPAEVIGLSRARFDRLIDSTWRRTSYTGLTSEAHAPVVSSEPQAPGLSDEDPFDEVAAAGTSSRPGPAPGTDGDARTGPAPAAAAAAAPEADEVRRLTAVRLPLTAVPGGTSVGSLVHAVLEAIDFAADDLTAALDDALRDALARWPVPVGDPAVVVAGLHAALLTPLGPLAGGRTLHGLRSADRLDELSFELPVAGGDRPAGAVDLAAVADLVEAHLPSGDPLTGYPERLRDPAVGGAFCGFLTGSLDLVARWHHTDGTARFSVIDYKTNVLGPDRTSLTAWDYRPAALATAMQRAHYPLQALLYLVALHRYLRWRLPGYLPDRHLGGALYLFLRGMTGPDGPQVDGQPCGVFAWRPPAGLVVDLSDLLDAGTP